jgi:hypothetical protein
MADTPATAGVIIVLLDYSFINDGRPPRNHYEGHFVVVVKIDDKIVTTIDPVDEELQFL